MVQSSHQSFLLWKLIQNVYLANFAENASVTGRTLESVLCQLKDT